MKKKEELPTHSRTEADSKKDQLPTRVKRRLAEMGGPILIKEKSKKEEASRSQRICG